jgi:hypothetical protein
LWTGDNLDFPFIAEALTLTGIRQVKSCCRQTDQECYQGDKTEDYCTMNVFFHHNPSSWKNGVIISGQESRKEIHPGGCTIA